MQRKLPTVPLMLVAGYSADGWLGMLIGTRMWYGFYGVVLSDQALFEAKLSELCRELGDRGCGSNVDVATKLNIEDSDRDHRDDASLRAELLQLKARQLRERATAAGASAEALDEADEAPDVKVALVDLVLGLHRGLAPATRIAAVLTGGGADALELVMSVLEHAAEVLEGVLASMPLRRKKEVRKLLERVETVAECADGGWCASLCELADEGA
eukprot:SAG31_NODE_10586_length_1121_cov_1.096869_2_plen_213_part_01